MPALTAPDATRRAAPRGSLRRRWLRRALMAIPFILLGLAVAWLSIIPALLRSGTWSHAISRELATQLGCPVRVESADFPNASTFVLRGVHIDRPVRGIDAVTIEFIRVRFPVLAPLGKPVEVIVEGVDARVAVSRGTGAETPPTPPVAPLPAPIDLPIVKLVRVRAAGTVEGIPFSVPALAAAVIPSARGFEFSAEGALAGSGPIDVRGSVEWGSPHRVDVRTLRVGPLHASGNFQGSTGHAALQSWALSQQIASWIELKTGARVVGTISGALEFGGSTFRLHADMNGYEVAKDALAIRGTSAVNLEGSKSGSSWNGKFSLGAGSGTAAGGAFQFDSLEGTLETQPERGEIRFTGAQFIHPQATLTGLAGTLKMESRTLVILTLTAGTFARETRRKDLAGVVIRLRGTPTSIEKFEAELPGWGTITGRAAVTGDTWDITASSTGLDLAVIQREQLPDIEARGRVGFDAWVKLGPGGGSVSGVARLSGVGVRKGGLRMEDLRGDLPIVAAWGSETSIDGASGRIEWTEFAYPGGSLGPRGADVLSSVNSISIRSEAFSVRVTREKTFTAATGKLTRLSPVPGLDIGQADFTAKLAGESLEARAEFSGVAYTRGDLEIAQACGTLQLERHGELSAVKINLGRLEVLKGDLYADLAGHTLAVAAAGRRPGPGNYVVDQVKVALSDVGTISAAGRIIDGVPDFRIETEELAIDALLRRACSLLSIEGLAGRGTVRISASVNRDSAEGRVFLRDLAVKKGGLEVVDAAGEIPFAVNRPAYLVQRGWIAFKDLRAVPAIGLGPRRIALSARSDRFSLDTPILVDAWGGRIEIDDVFTIDTFGPEFRIALRAGIEKLKVEEVCRALGSKLEIHGILTMPVGRITLSRNLATVEPRIRCEAFDGRVELRSIRVLQPFDAVQKAIQCAFTMEDLRLKSLTRALMDHGVMDGLLSANGEIEVHGSGKPNWFRIEASTREASGITQELNMDAVKKIAKHMGHDAAKMDPLGVKSFFYSKFGFYAVLDPGWQLNFRGRYFVPREGPQAGQVVEHDLADLKKGIIPSDEGTEYIMKGASPSIFQQLMGKYGEINIINTRPGAGTDFSAVWKGMGKVEVEK